MARAIHAAGRSLIPATPPRRHRAPCDRRRDAGRGLRYQRDLALGGERSLKQRRLVVEIKSDRCANRLHLVSVNLCQCNEMARGGAATGQKKECCP